MKKVLPALFFFAFLFQSMAVRADFFEDSCCDDPCFCFDECCSEASLAAKFAAFFPLSPKVRRIYNSAMPDFTLEGNLKLCSGCCGDWYAWLDGSYIYASGRSHGYGCSSTHLNFVPITLGVKYVYSLFPCMDVYLGLGAAYSFLNIRDHSRYVHRKTSANNSGALVKSGFIYRYAECFYLEGFLNYSYQKFYFHKHEDHPYVERHDVNLSSLQLGMGIGCTF